MNLGLLGVSQAPFTFLQDLKYVSQAYASVSSVKPIKKGRAASNHEKAETKLLEPVKRTMKGVIQQDEAAKAVNIPVAITLFAVFMLCLCNQLKNWH